MGHDKENQEQDNNQKHPEQEQIKQHPLKHIMMLGHMHPQNFDTMS